MDDQDLDLQQPTDEPTIFIAPPPETSHTGPRILAALLIVAVVVTGYFVFRNRNPASSAQPPASSLSDAPPAAAPPLGAEAEAVTLPPLDESDEAVRELVKSLSSHPSVLAWLASDDLIRTFTVVVSNIATGDSAAGQVPTLKPGTGFLVEERGEDLFVNPRSYARYTPLATAATSIDPAGAARLYTTLKPRIGDAYRELGYPETLFDRTLERAIVLLLTTPIPSGRVAVHPAGVVYGFADPKLEALTPSQKLLIRFGPDNQRAVQSSLRAIALALGIPPERLP
jgi:hypothetical protein